jgi:hypothetical protein
MPTRKIWIDLPSDILADDDWLIDLFTSESCPTSKLDSLKTP